MKEDNLRVLVISPDLKLMGGVADTISILLRELQGKVAVHHAAFGRRAGQKGMNRYLQPVADLISIAGLLRKQGYDVIHINPSFNIRSIVKEFFLYCVLCMCGYSGRILVFFHGWDQRLFNSISGSHLLKKILCFFLGRAGHITVLSSKYRDLLLGMDIPADKVSVMSTMFSSVAIPEEIPDFEQRKSILFLSRMVRMKGVYELVEAFESIASEYDGVQLIMAGDGEEKASLQSLVNDRGLKNVLFPGYISGDDKKKSLGSSGIFVLPTFFSEGCPVALLEAMAAGLVPIVPLAGGISDVVEPDRTAVVIDEVSSESLANGLRRLLDDADLWMDIALSAQKYARDNFESSRVCQRIIDLYGQIAAPRNI